MEFSESPDSPPAAPPPQGESASPGSPLSREMQAHGRPHTEVVLLRKVEFLCGRRQLRAMNRVRDIMHFPSLKGRLLARDTIRFSDPDISGPFEVPTDVSATSRVGTRAASARTRAQDPVANTRSSYRRTSNRYTTKGRKAKKIIIRLAIILGVVGALAGAALGIAHWAGILKPNVPDSGDDPTLIPLYNRGKEADLPVVNVDVLISGLTGLDAYTDGVTAFTTTKKSFAMTDTEAKVLKRAIARAEAALRPSAAVEPAQVVDGTEGEGEDGSEEEALDLTVDTSTVAIFAMDLEKGHGIAYNLDGYVEGAQITKAIFATFFASQFLDTAKATVETEGAHVQAAMSDSADARYESLRRSYDELGWDAWIGGVGAKSSTSANGYYPMTTTRMQAQAWLNVYRYLTGATYGATWLAQLLESPKDSLPVQALTTSRAIPVSDAPAKDGEEVQAFTIEPVGAEMVIWSFGGHANSPSLDRYCISETAIVLVGGESYLICVMTGLPDTTVNRALVSDLIAAAANAVIEVEILPDGGSDAA